MKSKPSNKILSTSLTELISKFAKDDVIEQMEKEYSTSRSKSIPLRLIKDNHYLRRVKPTDESIERLGKNLKANGFYTPILVREYNGKYEIVLGRKRYFAAKLAGIEYVPCIIGDFREEEILLILLADARDQRETNVVEMAIICKELSRRFNYTQYMLGELSHQSRPQITNIMRLLTLPEIAIKDIENNKLSYGHAKCLVTLKEEEIIALLPKIYAQKLSVRDTEQEVQKLKKNGSKSTLALEKKFNARRVDNHKLSVTFSFNTKEETENFINDILKK